MIILYADKNVGESLISAGKVSNDYSGWDGPKQNEHAGTDARNKIDVELVPCSYTPNRRTSPYQVCEQL